VSVPDPVSVSFSAAEEAAWYARLPTMFRRQVRIGSYGSWYNYYLCEFSGDIQLPELDGIPGIKELTRQLGNLRFHSRAPRCQ